MTFYAIRRSAHNGVSMQRFIVRMCHCGIEVFHPKPENRDLETRNSKPKTRNQKLETFKPSNLQTSKLRVSRLSQLLKNATILSLREMTKKRIACNFHNKPARRVKSQLEKFLNFFNGHLEFSAPRGLL